MFLLTGIAEPESVVIVAIIVQMMLAMRLDDLTIGDQLVIVVDDQDSALLRELYRLVGLCEYRRNFTYATSRSRQRMGRLVPPTVDNLHFIQVRL